MTAELTRRLLLACLAYAEAHALLKLLRPLWHAGLAPLRIALGLP